MLLIMIIGMIVDAVVFTRLENKIHREKIKDAKIVSCPGCMAVTATLALAPMIRENIIDTKHIIVDSKIGSSGAGCWLKYHEHIHCMRAH